MIEEALVPPLVQQVGGDHLGQRGGVQHTNLTIKTKIETDIIKAAYLHVKHNPVNERLRPSNKPKADART